MGLGTKKRQKQSSLTLKTSKKRCPSASRFNSRTGSIHERAVLDFEVSPLCLRISAFDLICRHDLNLWLPVAKLDCASDADYFPLNHSESPIGRYPGPGRNKSSERLSGVFSSETDKCRTQRAGRQRDNPASYLDFFADIPNGFRVFYHYWLLPTGRNFIEKQSQNCDEKADPHCRFCRLHCDRPLYDQH